MSKKNPLRLKHLFLLLLGFFFSLSFLFIMRLMQTPAERITLMLAVAVAILYFNLRDREKVPALFQPLQKLFMLVPENITERPLQFGFAFGALAMSQMGAMVIIAKGIFYGLQLLGVMHV